MTTIMIPYLFFWSAVIRLDHVIQQRIGRFEVAATLNATLLAIAGLIQCGSDEVTELTWFMRDFSICYYVADIWRCNPLMILHHIVAIQIFAFTPDIAHFAAALLLLEAPLPFLNWALWIRADRPIPLYLKVAVVLSYFVTRVAIFPLALYSNVNALYAIHPMLPFPYLVLAGMNFRWFYEIIVKC